MGKTTHTRHHMSMNLNGLLRNMKGRKMTDLFTDEDGKGLTDLQARAYIEECQANGWRVIPMSDNCEGFDYQTGCPGHVISTSENKST